MSKERNCLNCGNGFHARGKMCTTPCNENLDAWICKPENQVAPVDMVNQPPHYTAGGIEVIDIIKAKMSPEKFQGFLLGNIIKYVTRFEHKNGMEDLKKAQWYINKLVEVVSA